MLARLHWGGGPVSAEQVWLHAHFQVVIEGSPVPWPRLRDVFWMLVGSVLIRTAEILADYGLEAVLPLVPLSGVLAWIALACLGAGILGAMRHRRAV
jgi:hypothetical protein